MDSISVEANALLEPDNLPEIYNFHKELMFGI